MAESSAERSEQFVHDATQRAEQIAQALRHLGRGISFGLVDVALHPDVDDESRQRLVALGHALTEIAEISHTLVSDVSAATGIDTGESDEERNVIPRADTEVPPRAPDLIGLPDPEPIGRDTAETADVPPTPVATQPASESDRESPPRGRELYTGFIDAKWAPEIPLVDDDKAIKVSLSPPFTLQIGDQAVELADHEGCLFNCCILLRNNANITPKTILELGFSPDSPGAEDAQQELFKTRRSLLEKLERASHQSIIGKQYRLNRNVVFVWPEETELSGDPQANGSEPADVKKN